MISYLCNSLTQTMQTTIINIVDRIAEMGKPGSEVDIP